MTGTSLRGVAPVGSTIVRLDQRQMQATGLTSTSDILQTIPQVSGIGPNQGTSGTNANNATLNNTYANSIDLRGLGVQATLNLLDGRRVPPGGVGAELFDPSSIPVIALSRIDVVPDGASGIYGSDAVGGVANLILRKNFVGLEADANYGTASNYSQRQFDVIGGTKWEGGSLMLAGEFSEHTDLNEAKRSSLFQCNEVPYGGTNNCSFDAAPGNVINPATNTRYALPGGSGVGLTASRLTANTANLEQAYTGQDVIPEQQRASIVGSFSQNLTDGIKFWSEGYYTDRRFDQSLQAATIDSSTPVPSSNPYFISFYPGQKAETVQYSLLNDLGPEKRTGSEQAFQIAGGFDVDLGSGFQLTAYAEHNEDIELSYSQNLVNTAALESALADSNPATAFNPYGTGGNNNPATLASIRSFSNIGSVYQQDLGNVKVDGPLFNLPGGPVRLAVGGQFYGESLNDTQSQNNSTPSVADIDESTNTTNTRNVGSVYSEVLIPIVGADNSVPFVRRLELDAAGRYDHYSDVGGTANPKISLRWDPIHDLTIHGTYGTSFRAPTLCDVNPACTATVFTIPNFGPGGNVVEVAGGNPELKPETATTESFGADYRPSWVPGLKASINYFHINYENIIDTPALFNIAAFTQPQLYAPFVTLHPSVAQLESVFAEPYAPPPTIALNQINALVDGRRANVGQSISDGLDLGLDYNFENRFGAWDIGADGTYEFNYMYQLVKGAPFVDRLNQANYPLRFRWRDHLSWSKYGVAANVFVNHTNGYDNTTGTIAPNQPISGYTTVDLHLAYNTGNDTSISKYLRRVTFAINVQNLFNAEPPLAIVSTSQQYDSLVANPIGRMVTFDLRRSF